MVDKKHKDNLNFSKAFVGGESQYIFWDGVTKVMSFINSFFIFKSLNLYQYGVFQLLLSFQDISSEFLATGSSVATVEMGRLIGARKEAEAKRLFVDYNKFKFIFSFLIWSLLFFGIDFLDAKYDNSFRFLVKLISILFLTEVFLGTLRSLLRLRLFFDLDARRNSNYKTAQMFFLGFFYFTTGLEIKTIIMSMIFGSVITSISLLTGARKAFGFWSDVKMSNQPVLMKLFLNYGKWDIIRRFFVRANVRMLPWLIKLFINTEAVGIYSVASSMVGIIKNFIGTRTLATLITRRLDDEILLKTVFGFGMKYFSMASFLAMSASWVVVPMVVKIFFPQYLAVLPFFYILSLNLPFKSFGHILGIFLIAYQKQKFMFFQKMLSAGLNLLLLVLFLPLFGLWGLVVPEVLIDVLLTYISYKYVIGFKPAFALSRKMFFTYTDDDRALFSLVYKNLRGLYWKAL